MALRLADDSGERGGDDRDGLKEARRAVGATRARLEELADRLRELGRRLGGGSDDGRASPEIGTGTRSSGGGFASALPFDQGGSRSPS
jgi:hypothetical protein